uniref:Uncharacterized protein n=1 Tax=Siphoviridae sp. ctrpg19 TaxID=2826481 RepID=A0A8S5MK25_9CAUD|nr:MAG TPA: hypothetical protein [Siphoviridae sp. ctrpg19]
MDYTIKIPNFPFKVGDKVKRNNELLYISDIVFSMTDFDWLVIAFIIDEKDVIKKTITIPYKIFFPDSLTEK